MYANGTPPVIVAGAGIAGLTAALAFSARGISTRIFEQAPSIETVGAGIQLSPNASRILDRCDVLETLRAKAVQPQAVVLKDAATLRVLARVPLGKAAETRWGAPYLVIHRADLQAALTARVLESPHISLVTGARVRDIVTKPEGPSVRIESSESLIAGSLLVGADGVWSAVRRLCRDHGESRFTGELAWRTTIGIDSDAGAAFAAIGAGDCVTTFLHGGFHLVAYPISAGAAVNLVAFTPGERMAEGWSGKADAAILERALRGAAPALVRLVETAGPWTTWPLHTVDAKAAWTAPGIALIGDAAHAMTPFAAQGAAMGIEDAETLAGCFAAARIQDLAGALREWERSRRARVLRAVRRGALNRLAWHAAGPVALARNLFLKSRSPESLAADLDWLYGWKAPKA
jgi:salicylate hydroxylase